MIYKIHAPIVRMAEKKLFESHEQKEKGFFAKALDYVVLILLIALDIFLVISFVQFFEENTMITTIVYVILLPILVGAHIGIVFLLQSRKNKNFLLSDKYICLSEHEGEEEKIQISSITGITMMNALRHTSFVIINFDKRREVYLIDKSKKTELANALIKAGFAEYERLGFIGQLSFKLKGTGGGLME